MYLPPKKFITKDYLKQILKSDKDLLMMEQIKPIKVPRYQELSVKSLYKEGMEDENLKKYLTDLDIDKKPIDREYFFNVLNSIYPDYVMNIIRHAQNSRIVPEMNYEKKDYILISDEWYNKLMSQPFISRKPGKTIQLLKESTKIYKGRKQKNQKQLGFSLKRFKGMNGEQISTFNRNSSQLQSELYDFNEVEEDIDDMAIKRKQTFNI